MATEQELEEVRKVARRVTQMIKANKGEQEEIRIYEQQGPHALAMHRIGRDVASREAKEAEITQSKRRLEAQKSRAADETLAQAIVQPMANTSPVTFAPPAAPRRQPVTGNSQPPLGRAKARHKPRTP